jgi:hypothetical protein
MFQRLQLWKNEWIGIFYSFVMSGRRLEGIPQGRPQHDVLVRRALVLLCCFFLTAFSTVGQKLQINIHPVRQCDSEFVFFRHWQAAWSGGQFTA